VEPKAAIRFLEEHAFAVERAEFDQPAIRAEIKTCRKHFPWSWEVPGPVQALIDRIETALLPEPHDIRDRARQFREAAGVIQLLVDGTKAAERERDEARASYSLLFPMPRLPAPVSGSWSEVSK
jgi:hypothetical protein